ncbi:MULTISPECIES: HNH endonuclease [Delftia]|jgi:hypothetical protein|uniref:HNH endonuclease n=1 Tax=Delftia lacustris TaxID=558537 RepID=A0A7T2YUP9_9BURK|nr:MULTISPECIES: HNH endonuclease [Delftia]EPD45290.1 5-methylcytosine-specific restriction enzyme A [Delftia acidovorans CCUG 15835]KAA9176553.1 HNH endonuclease [Delftia sp. BR1]QPS82381.1 HNH endonuclease [Delftia lacustris]
MANSWSNEELLASVNAYFQMAEKQESRSAYKKKEVYEELAVKFGRTAKAFEYRMQNISAVLDELNLPWIPGLKPAVNVGADVKSRLSQLIKNKNSEKVVEASNLNYERTWEKALDAVTQLGGFASRKQVKEWILTNEPEYNAKNLTDLYMMAVNSPARTGYSQNASPRRTDHGNRYDKLFKVGKGIFEIYDPVQHGVWEIYSDTSSSSRFGVSIRRISKPIGESLEVAEKEAEQEAAFNPTSVVDARKRVNAHIVRRRGQPEFRAALMEAYGNACSITNCDLPAVLEAAHIHPYKGDHTNVLSNGLLLRSDIHTLFDLRLISIESKTMLVRVAPELANTEYRNLEGLSLRRPKKNSQRVSSEALDWHFSQCEWCD